MKDFMKLYKQKNIIHNLSILGVSLALAFWINFSMNDSGYGKLLKSSVLDATQETKNKGDMYLQLNNNGESIAIKSWTPLTQVTKVAFSLSYNPEGLKVNTIIPTESSTTGQNIANTPWFQTTFLLFPSPKDIQAGETLATIQVQKLSQKIEYLNIFSVNTEDTNKNITELSSSGIDF
jgi:hypothetical protein